MDIVTLLIDQLSLSKKVKSDEFSTKTGIDHSVVVGGLLSLSSTPEALELTKDQISVWKLTDEGVSITEKGSHEYLIFQAIPSDGISLEELKKNYSENAIGFNKAMNYGWARIDKSNPKSPRVLKLVTSVEDVTKNDLISIMNGLADSIPSERVEELKKRKLIQKITTTVFTASPGPSFEKVLVKEETDITSSMIAKGTWKDSKFKKYNFVSLGVIPSHGCLHPLMKVKNEIRQIFLSLGFSEMATNNYVESSFWNFDALFQPQQHPARDAHDTFFMESPNASDLSDAPVEYINKVKDVHERGGNGSIGYQYKWKIEEAQKLILRTHTTAVSTRMLYKLAQNKQFEPVKYFSIDRVFRNEATDSTHLSEFHQIEGLVADRNLGLNHLIGFLHEFFKKLGMEKLRFKPAYNPYTEPSLEIFSYHNGLKKWVEVGNSGVFRREMLDPMGIPEDVSVIAWGLSLERPTMIKYGIDNIRSLIGHKIDLEMVQKSSAYLIGV